MKYSYCCYLLLFTKYLNSYILGTCGGIWVVTWLLVARETPRDHLSISKNELHYIESSLETHTLQNKNIPWKTILTSISVWIAAITMFCEGWGYYTL